MEKILSVQNGYSEDADFFSTEEKYKGYPTFVHEIIQSFENERDIVYTGYQYPGPVMVFKMYAGPGVLVRYKI